MKFKYMKGGEGDTDKMPDFTAMHMETLHKAGELLKEIGLYYVIFSIDQNDNGGGTVNLPPAKKLIQSLGVLVNMDDQLKSLYNGKIRLFAEADGKFYPLPLVVAKTFEEIQDARKGGTDAKI